MQANNAPQRRGTRARQLSLKGQESERYQALVASRRKKKKAPKPPIAPTPEVAPPIPLQDSTPKRPLFFPAEIVLEILSYDTRHIPTDEVTATHFDGFEFPSAAFARRDLLTCSLVSKVWSGVAQHLLYRDVQISFKPGWLGFSGENCKLVRTLEGSVRLGAMVRTITVKVARPPYRGDSTSLQEESSPREASQLSRIASACPNLSHAYVRGGIPFGLLRSIKANFVHLYFGHHMSGFSYISGIGENSTAPMNNVDSFTQVHTLSLGESIYCQPPETFFTSLPQLKSLKIRGAYRLCPIGTLEALQPLAATLRHLLLAGQCSIPDDRITTTTSQETAGTFWRGFIADCAGLEQLDVSLDLAFPLAEILAAVPATLGTLQIDVYPHTSVVSGKGTSDSTKALDPLLRAFATGIKAGSKVHTVRLYGTAGVGWYSVKTEEEALRIKAVTRATLDLFKEKEVRVVFASQRKEFRL